MTISDYINATLGAPYKAGASGQYGKFDCWGLVVDSFAKIDGVKLPKLSAYKGLDLVDGMVEALQKGQWAQIPVPMTGCVVACFDKKGALCHVGRYFYGKLFHASGVVEKDGAVALWPMAVAHKKFARLEYWQWR